MNKKIILCLVLLCTFAIGCESNPTEVKNEPSISNVVDNDKKNKDVFSYEQYTTLIQDFAEKVQIPNYEIKNTPLIKSLVLVEEELTFDKKQSLTLEGNKSDMRPTQQILMYENKDQSTQIQIRIGFTKNYLDEDLVIWDSSKGFEETNKELSSKTDVATYLYKNLVISILVNTEKDASIPTMRNAMHEIVDFLTNY
ncbi:MAG: hypothetical protein ACE3L7_33040 [Candidatus Pristimantibacillus sp.]